MSFRPNHSFFPTPTTRVLASAVVLFALSWLATPSHSQDALRWSEMGYGVSLTPPPATAQVEGKAVTWIDPRGFSVSFEIVRTEQPVDLETMTSSAMVQMGFAQATPRLLDAEGNPSDKPPVPERIADRPAVRMYFELDQQDKPDWLNIKKEDQVSWFYGQAIVMLEPHAAAIIKLTATRENQQIGQDAFEAVLDSLHIPLGSELDAAREELVERANTWLQSTRPEDWAKALPQDQWYRVIQKGKDVGHVHVRSSREPADLKRFQQEAPGTLAVIDRRDHLNETQALDSRSVYYAHDDNQREFWETKTTLRPVKKKAGLANRSASQALTWVQIGIRGTQKVTRRDIHGNMVPRSVNVVTVITETPPSSQAVQQIESHERFTGKQTSNNIRGKVDENQQWVAPDRSYLSQLQVWALGGMLPAEPAVYCFSAYHAEAGKPGLRTVEVLPQDDGTLVVLDRPNSSLSPVRSVYDADRKLIERVTPQGLRIVPTTREELAEVWGISLD
ncbi:hypothetical protein [Algisphaera agarilytica]|uniref:Uncharacterized protein n=1 Tax=Algisphaera agarilytica TaxID=1385975 RepID=A0A7X0LKW1_9BACT|nr:hypothetical protein [Algisphaera agarilytica]MBB6430860.1 hypothetical protein [Algisphaera agarilytica]